MERDRTDGLGITDADRALLLGEENPEVIKDMIGLEVAFLGRSLFIQNTSGQDKRIGHSLPLKADNSSHVVIATDGALAIICSNEKYPEPEIPSSIKSGWYRFNFGGTGRSIIISKFGGSLSIHLFDHLYRHKSSYRIDGLIDGRLPQNVETVTNGLTDAIRESQKEREIILNAARANSEVTLSKLARFKRPPTH